MDPQNTPPATPFQPPATNSSPPTVVPAPPALGSMPPSPVVAPPVIDTKQQVADRLKEATNVLVTVGADPSVDALSSAIGLTLLLDKLGKNATTVFSGAIPRAIEFLHPEATIEDNVDSLRDFIIALDKEKADKLRYKVEEDVVRIFITPYKTKITEKDLAFSQGDFNVDVVIALGVTKRDDLDKAITAHGRILHDATVISVNTSPEKSSLGSIDWEQQDASSIAEMLMGLTDVFGPTLLDEQISSAYLTGLVAATNRFSNEKTTPKVMTIAAQLMAAGANQQLIASNLRQDGFLSDSIREAEPGHEKQTEFVVEHEKKKHQKSDDEEKESKAAASTDDAPSDEKEEVPEQSNSDEPKEEEPTEELSLPDDLKQQLEPDEPTIEDVKSEESSAPEPIVTPETEEVSNQEPAFNATMAQVSVPDESSSTEEGAPALPVAPPTSSEPASTEEASSIDTPVDAGSGVEASMDDVLEEARRAVETASEAAPFTPDNNPLESINAQPLATIDHDAALPDNTMSEAPAISTHAEGLSSFSSAPDSASAPTVASDSEPTQDFLSGGTDAPDPSPMDSFMSAHTSPVVQPLSSDTSLVTDAAATTGDTAALNAPPLPPALPPVPTDPTLPPLPPLPGAPSEPTAPALQPSVQPAFMQDMPTSQNPWTQAADELAAKQQTAEANRQAKMDEMTAQYDAAVEVNRDLQGLPPVNGGGSPSP